MPIYNIVTSIKRLQNDIVTIDNTYHIFYY